MLDEVHLGRLRCWRWASLVHCNDPKLNLALLLQSFDLEGQRFGPGRGLKAAAVVPLCPAFELLLDDVVHDLATTITGRWSPNEVNRRVVVIRDFRSSRLARLVWRKGVWGRKR